MSSFIQSEAWQKFQEQAGVNARRHQKTLFLQRSFGFGTYWQASRFTCKEFTLPAFAGEAVFLRLEPEDVSSLQVIQQNNTLEETVAIQPRQSLLLTIDKPLETVVAGFKQKHRYNYGVSQRSGLREELFSNKLSGKPFERFWQLMQATADRQEFRTHPKEYYQQMLESLEPEGMAHIIIISKDEADLAAMILITHDDTATYLHGASSNQQRQVMAPYFLHVAAIRHAQHLGLKTYDFWGTDAHYTDKGWLPKEGAASYGTTRFKLGFGGDIVTYPGCFDLILKPFWYNLYKTARRLRGGKRAFS